jgi:hypothetical protein
MYVLSFMNISTHTALPLSCSALPGTDSQPLTYEFIQETPYGMPNRTSSTLPQAPYQHPSRARQEDHITPTHGHVAPMLANEVLIHTGYEPVHTLPNGRADWQHLPRSGDLSYPYEFGLPQAPINTQTTSAPLCVDFMDFQTGLTPEPNVQGTTPLFAPVYKVGFEQSGFFVGNTVRPPVTFFLYADLPPDPAHYRLQHQF